MERYQISAAPLNARLHYLEAKARLAGMFTTLPRALLVCLSAFGVLLLLEGILTPYSVDVSGYTRSNGTYVAPYRRRQPGSARNEENLQVIAGLAFVVMGVGAYRAQAFPIFADCGENTACRHCVCFSGLLQLTARSYFWAARILSRMARHVLVAGASPVNH